MRSFGRLSDSLAWPTHEENEWDGGDNIRGKGRGGGYCLGFFPSQRLKDVGRVF